MGLFPTGKGGGGIQKVLGGHNSGVQKTMFLGQTGVVASGEQGANTFSW